MTALPFVEEIRAARKRATHAALAIDAMRRLKALDLALEVLVAAGETKDLPGDTLLQQLGEAWPELEIPDALPETAVDRRALCGSVDIILQPIVEHSAQFTRELRELQIKQREQLETPKWREEARVLHDIEHRRQHLLQDLGELQQRCARIEPTIIAIDQLASSIEAQIATAEAGGIRSVAAGDVTERLLEAAASLVSTCDLTISLPATRTEHEDLIPAMHRIVSGLRDATTQLNIELDHARVRHKKVEAQAATLGTQLTEQMG